MWNELNALFADPSGLTPHGFCLLWEPGLIWTYAISDIGIGVAYFTIPLALAVFVRRRRDLVFRPIFLLFAAFILLCGLTHWLDVLTLWVPAYRLEALVKAATSVVSLITAVTLWTQIPRALALPSPAQLREANAALRESQDRLHQAQKMEAVGQLTGGIAHDFNNTLQVIRSGLNLMARRIARGQTTELGRYLDSIEQAVERSASLTHRLLAFSRRQTLVPRPIDPRGLVRGMEALIRRTLGPGTRLELRMDGSMWAAFSDPHQLETALLNLAINARDAMPEGGTLTVSVTDRCITPEPAELSAEHHAGENAGEYVEITVTDTGAGMTPEVLTRVFEPFFTTKPPGRGTGLGLSQVYGFIRQSNGFVRIASEPGKGTEVRLYLPRAPEDQCAAILSTGDAAAAVHPIGAMALVVEDEAGIRTRIVEALLETGYKVLEAEDGTTAVQLLQSDAALDLLITDIGLPGLNGRQVAEAGRARRPDLPVLLITGHSAGALDAAPLAPGMEILHKPFTIDQLLSRAAAMLKQPRETVV